MKGNKSKKESNKKVRITRENMKQKKNKGK